MQMVVDGVVTIPDLYDGTTQSFRRGAIREEMVRRGIRRDELLSWALLSPATLRRAMAGRSVKDTTAASIVIALARRRPL